jgi:hypothetical protein
MGDMCDRRGERAKANRRKGEQDIGEKLKAEEETDDERREARGEGDRR